MKHYSVVVVCPQSHDSSLIYNAKKHHLLRVI